MAPVQDELQSEARLQRQLTPEMRSDVIAPITKHLPLARWGFRLSWIGDPIRDAPWHSPLIYDSPSCRLGITPQVDYRALLDGVRQPTNFYVLYGRCHAPSQALGTREWKEKRCVAWHDIRRLPFAHFFEGITPRSLWFSYLRGDSKRRHRSAARIDFDRKTPPHTLGRAERDLAFHAFLWDRYGERLFSLFDLQQPEQWRKLRAYLRQYYKRVPYAYMRPRKRDRKGIKPWKVC